MISGQYRKGNYYKVKAEKREGKCGIKKELCLGDYTFTNWFHMYDFRWSFLGPKILSFPLLGLSLSLKQFLTLVKKIASGQGKVKGMYNYFNLPNSGYESCLEVLPCVCVRESERERERDRKTDRQAETEVELLLFPLNNSSPRQTHPYLDMR